MGGAEGVHGEAGATTQLPPRLLDDADGSDARAALSSHTPRFWLAVDVGVKRVPRSARSFFVLFFVLRMLFFFRNSFPWEDQCVL